MYNSNHDLRHIETEQDFHHYAYDENGALIFLEKGKLYDRKDYVCLACGETMRAVMGDEKDWHFRHKTNNPNCNTESYLHRLAKDLLKKKFDNEEAFNIAYYVKERCPLIDSCPHHSEKCYRIYKNIINLKELYDTCEEEKTDGEAPYRGDIKLSNKSNYKTKPLFVEISYTHDCKPEKIESGIQIIEIKVNEEKDILQPLEENYILFLDYDSNNPYQYSDLPPVRFYNFNRQINEKKYKRNCEYLKAKRLFKKRFSTSESLPIVYNGLAKCPLTTTCNLASKNCNRSHSITEDLKKDYNLCKENTNGDLILTNSENNIPPLTIKFSFEEKAFKEENGRIIEFRKLSDVKKYIRETELLHLDLDKANPYGDSHMATTRFYNFERHIEKKGSIQLRRFVVVKDKKFLFGILDNEYNVNCQLNYEHPSKVVYELLFPDSFNYRFDMLLFGIIKANINGIPIKHCILCRHCHKERNGCVRYGEYMFNLLSVNEINKFEESEKCQSYSRIDLHNFLISIEKKMGENTI